MAQGGAVSLGNENETVSEIVQNLKRLDPSSLGKILRELQKKKTLTIVVSGRTGVGKSTLIGSLLPEVVTKVQDGPTQTDHDVVERYEGMIRGVPVTVYDTRGFCSLGSSYRDALRLHKELERIFQSESQESIDLFIFCQEMFSRFDESSLKALSTFGSLLKESAWEFCVVALTKANMSPATMRSYNDKKAKLKMTQLTAEVKKKMQKEYFSQRGLLEISNKISFVPVGCITEDMDERAIPGSSNSILDLEDQLLLQCRPQSVGVLITALNNDEKKRSIVSLVLSALGITGVGAAVGAVAGAGIGLAFGGFGAIPGALAGAAIGAGGAASAYGVGRTSETLMKKIWKTFKQLNKHKMIEDGKNEPR